MLSSSPRTEERGVLSSSPRLRLQRLQHTVLKGWLVMTEMECSTKKEKVSDQALGNKQTSEMT